MKRPSHTEHGSGILHCLADEIEELDRDLAREVDRLKKQEEKLAKAVKELRDKVGAWQPCLCYVLHAAKLTLFLCLRSTVQLSRPKCKQRMQLDSLPSLPRRMRMRRTRRRRVGQRGRTTSLPHHAGRVAAVQVQPLPLAAARAREARQGQGQGGRVAGRAWLWHPLRYLSHKRGTSSS